MEDYGLLQSMRVHYTTGREVEFGVTTRAWASINPVDPGTRQVVSDGIQVLYDPEWLLSSLMSNIAASSAHVKCS